jgi:hypothetical protein
MKNDVDDATSAADLFPVSHGTIFPLLAGPKKGK